MREAEFRSEVKHVNKSEEGGERVSGESVSQSLSECGGSKEKNSKSRVFRGPELSPPADLASFMLNMTAT